MQFFSRHILILHIRNGKSWRVQQFYVLPMQKAIIILLWVLKVYQALEIRKYLLGKIYQNNLTSRVIHWQDNEKLITQSLIYKFLSLGSIFFTFVIFDKYLYVMKWLLESFGTQNRASCSTIVALNVGDVINVQRYNHYDGGSANGFMGFLLWLLKIICSKRFKNYNIL